MICFDCKPVGEKPDTVCRRDIDSSKQEVMGPEFLMVVYLYCNLINGYRSSEEMLCELNDDDDIRSRGNNSKLQLTI